MEKIMIIEDDPMLVEIYQKKFTDAGFEVKFLMSGATAKDEAKKWKPDIILLDAVLPEMDGFEVLESIKKEAEVTKIPVYMFSNLSAKEDKDRALNLGAAGFLTKSNFTPSQLTEEIRKILGKEPAVIPEFSVPTKEMAEDYAISKKDSNGYKVLIVEDEEIFIQMFGDKLKQEGFEVTAAKNGQWGIAEAEKGGFDCILLDMMMPAMNGYEAVQELRKKEKTRNIPVIILSNSALDSEVKKALDLGADAYYVKALVTPSEVAKEVKRLIKAKAGKNKD